MDEANNRVRDGAEHQRWVRDAKAARDKALSDWQVRGGKTSYEKAVATQNQYNSLGLQHTLAAQRASYDKVLAANRARDGARFTPINLKPRDLHADFDHYLFAQADPLVESYLSKSFQQAPVPAAAHIHGSAQQDRRPHLRLSSLGRTAIGGGIVTYCGQLPVLKTRTWKAPSGIRRLRPSSRRVGGPAPSGAPCSCSILRSLQNDGKSNSAKSVGPQLARTTTCPALPKGWPPVRQ